MIHKIQLENKEIHLIGTAHVSRASVEEVRSVLVELQPDAVAIELDDERYRSMSEPKTWEQMDIVQIIRQKRTGFLLAQMILASYQRKLAKQFELNAGDEMLEAINYTKAHEVKLNCIDRPIHTTLLRIWRSLGTWEKIKMASELVGSVFEPGIGSEDIEKLKESDMLTAALAEVSKQFPSIAESLVRERDRIMAQKLRKIKGERIVAVVGAAHVPGILKHIETDEDIRPLMSVPQAPKSGQLKQWIVPVILVALISLSILKTPNLAWDTLLRFVLINGSLAALGTLLAFGHPLSILTAFLMAPIGVLSPFLATGWFAGLTEAWVRKPKVEDFMNLQEDVLHLSGYWKNRVARILLVVVFANLFASFGSIFTSIDLIRNLWP